MPITHKDLLINVGGFKHRVLRKTLRKFPDSRLHDILKYEENENMIEELCDNYEYWPSDDDSELPDVQEKQELDFSYNHFLDEIEITDEVSGKNNKIFKKTILSRKTPNNHYGKRKKWLKEIYFDRSPRAFNHIIDYYRSGCIQLPERYCKQTFLEDLSFWGFKYLMIEEFCDSTMHYCMKASNNRASVKSRVLNRRLTMMPKKTSKTQALVHKYGKLIVKKPSSDNSSKNNSERKTKTVTINTTPQDHSRSRSSSVEDVVFSSTAENMDDTVDDFISSYKWGQKNRLRLWILFEVPNSSKIAQMIATISLIFIILSTILVIIDTCDVSDYSKHIDDILDLDLHSDSNSNSNVIPEPPTTTTFGFEETPTTMTLHDHAYDPYHIKSPFFNALENIMLGWFTLEFLLRLIACPNLLDFFKRPLNYIDMIAIIPGYIVIIIVYFVQHEQEFYSYYASASTTDMPEIGPPGPPGENIEKFGQFSTNLRIFRALQIMRALRALRILKIARHSAGLKTFGHTLSKSRSELSLLLLFVLVNILIFSSLVYFVEYDQPNSQFTSIPVTCWWAIVTITTVGYGDMTPTSDLGKFFAAICTLVGVLVIALPVSVISTNFNLYYRSAKRHRKNVSRRNTLILRKTKSFIEPGDEDEWT